MSTEQEARKAAKYPAFWREGTGYSETHLLAYLVKELDKARKTTPEVETPVESFPLVSRVDVILEVVAMLEEWSKTRKTSPSWAELIKGVEALAMDAPLMVVPPRFTQEDESDPSSGQ